MSLPFPEPTRPAPREEVLLGYLDYFRSVVLAKLDGLVEQDLRSSRLASGWSPLELLKHLVAMEQRWLVWGFAGEEVGDPWFDQHDGRWHVDSEETLESLSAQLERVARRTREVVGAHALADVGVPSERWDGEPPATLERVLLHVIQEYARHAGHLDIVRELADGEVPAENS